MQIHFSLLFSRRFSQSQLTRQEKERICEVTSCVTEFKVTNDIVKKHLSRRGHY